MKKILIASDGMQFPESSFAFASQLNELSPVLLTGVFMPQLSYANLWSVPNPLGVPLYVPLSVEEDGEALENTIEQFQRRCIQNGIAFRIHRDFTDFALEDLRKETRFADLLLISSERFFQSFDSDEPGEFLKYTIQQSECPVLAIPENFSFPELLVIAYDGSPSSVYALKQFAYLFPELANLETVLVYSKEDEEKEVPDKDFIQELATQHFPKLELMKLDINPKKYFAAWLQEQKPPLLISGSYGRSSLSNMFKKSFATEVIADRQLPVFIAHK